MQPRHSYHGHQPHCARLKHGHNFKQPCINIPCTFVILAHISSGPRAHHASHHAMGHCKALPKLSAFLSSNPRSTHNARSTFNQQHRAQSMGFKPSIQFVLGLACLGVCLASPVLQGYDVVEYFALNESGKEDAFGVLGISTFACRLKSYDKSGGKDKLLGVYEFWFSSTKNVKLFKKDPWKYAPKYGGFSALGIATETAPDSPWSKDHLGPPANPWDAWLIKDGALSLHSSTRGTQIFSQFEEQRKAADERWIEWYGDLEAGPFNLDCQSRICRDVPQAPMDVSGVSESTPDVDCTTSGFTTPHRLVGKRVGQTQLDFFKGKDGSNQQGVGSFLGASGSLSGSGGGPGNPVQDSTRKKGKNPSASSSGSESDTISPHSPLGKRVDGKNFVRPVLMGYDVVEYFKIKAVDEGVLGSSKYVCHLASYDRLPKKPQLIGVYEFWFANRMNMEEFGNDPWKFAPVYGGFCSWGIATELKRDGWPWEKSFLGPPGQPWDGWTVYDGELYINYWPVIAARFFEDAEENIRLGKERWESWFGDVRAGPFNTHCPNAACVLEAHKQNLSPACPRDAICKGDIPEVRCLVRSDTVTVSLNSEQNSESDTKEINTDTVEDSNDADGMRRLGMWLVTVVLLVVSWFA